MAFSEIVFFNIAESSACLKLQTFDKAGLLGAGGDKHGTQTNTLDFSCVSDTAVQGLQGQLLFSHLNTLSI